ncbi:unnamed protein product [Sphenostylis stenocarpa]|uniref:Uncharacterized protein n=1 Tax=Sphenostylis stenocarpa TaxID=92480 RepID=A0AA86SHG6_9FABA|nr:unnamed protein product [Sphenostylis stenocarpa]
MKPQKLEPLCGNHGERVTNLHQQDLPTPTCGLDKANQLRTVQNKVDYSSKNGLEPDLIDLFDSFGAVLAHMAGSCSFDLPLTKGIVGF